MAKVNSKHQEIMPPFEIKNLIDSTAKYVAEKGESFEQKLFLEIEKDQKFSFLKEGDYYHPYYKKKLKELRGEIDPIEQIKKETAKIRSNINTMQKIQEQLKANPPRPPPPDQFSLYEPPQLQPFDREVIKQTALYIAKNGQSFFNTLSEKYAREPQFDFMKPTHLMNTYFNQLIEMYTKCMNPKAGDIKKFDDYSLNYINILKLVGERYEYERVKLEADQKTRDQRIKQEEKEVQQIDWHDFVVVETIVFEDENIAEAPTVSYKVNKKESEEMDIENEGEKIESINKKKIAEEVSDEGKIKLDYSRKPNENNDKLLKCPKCNNMIPRKEFEKHLHLELLDPNFIKNKLELENLDKSRPISKGDEITTNLNEFSKNRPDLFGTPAAEVKKEEKSKQGKLKYDGNLGAITRTTGSLAKLLQQQKMFLEEAAKNTGSKAIIEKRDQINRGSVQQQLNQQKSTTTTKPNAPSVISSSPIYTPLSYMKPGMQMASMTVGLSTLDKYKAENEASLMPDEEWISFYPNNVTINVKIPNSSEYDWNFKGQIIQLSMGPRTSVDQLKSALSSYLGNMPVKKMKLKTYNQNVLKDQFSIAHYNIIDNTMLELLPKERGGRKKY